MIPQDEEYLKQIKKKFPVGTRVKRTDESLAREGIGTICTHEEACEADRRLESYSESQWIWILFDHGDAMGSCYEVDHRGAVFHPPLLEIIGQAPKKQGAISVLGLKEKNSLPDAVNCAQCGHILKTPGFNIKHCPVCEP